MAVTGRPTSYTDEIAEELCFRLSQGESVRRICRDEHMPVQSTVYRWILSSNPIYSEFQKKYARAREAQAEALFDEILDIADDASNDYVETDDEDGGVRVNHDHIQRSRLRVDSRKWYLSKVLPKKFGEKLDLTSGGDKLHSASTILFDEPATEQDTTEEGA